MTVSEDSRLLCVALTDHRIQVWAAEQGEVRELIMAHTRRQ